MYVLSITGTFNTKIEGQRKVSRFSGDSQQ
jgi:hypothetical protein